MNSRKLRHIFVVDDESIIASTLAMILQRSGFSARSFTNPFEALVAATYEPPDLLISDVVMPELSGIELAVRLKEICPESLVLLFSGQAQTADLLQEAREKGHEFNLLSKPVHPSDLLNHIRAQECLVTRGASVQVEASFSPFGVASEANYRPEH